MFVVTVSWIVKPEYLQVFMTAMTQQAKDSLALEEACTLFHVAVDEGEPNHVFLYEHYLDKAAFDVHLASDHFKRFAEKVSDWVVSKNVSELRLVHS